MSWNILEDPTLPALKRLRGFLRSAGRYGNSPFLIGHYGGLGELAQGFCRCVSCDKSWFRTHTVFLDHVLFRVALTFSDGKFFRCVFQAKHPFQRLLALPFN
jgi:GDP dissociation inhibitor